MDLGRTLLRTVVGGLFIGHGTQKLFGWFGGPGPEGTAGFFEALDLRPSRPKALAAGAAETGAGAMLVLGALTPLAAAAITGVMATAIEKVHGPKGLWNTQGGYEFNLVMATSALALAADGPGRPSVDAALWPGLKGPGWALVALGAGLAAARAATSDRLPGFSVPRDVDQVTESGQQVPTDGASSE